MRALSAERFRVVGDRRRGREKRILDEDDDKVPLASRGQQRGVCQRLTGMLGEIDRAKDRLEERAVSHSHLL